MIEVLNQYNILVTRPAHQADTLCKLIEQQGWHSVRFPTLDIVAVDNNKIIQQLESLSQWDWLIFISTNAVNFALRANNGKIDAFKACSIAAVGKATKKALKLAGVSVDLLPDRQFNTEGLLATTEMMQVNGKGCLIVRGQGGRETLANSLRERGAKVDYMEVYSRVVPVADATYVMDMLKQGMLHAITITSGDALKNLVTMIGAELHNKLQVVPLIVISHRIKALAEEFGFKSIAVTENPGDRAIIETVGMMSLETQKIINGEG